MKNNVTCATCGKQFHRRPSRIKAANYCSLACANAANVGVKNGSYRGGKEIHECVWCGASFERYASQAQAANLFCSVACAHAHWRAAAPDTGRHINVLFGAESPRWRQIELTCDYCGCAFMRPPSQLNDDGHNYCCNTCKYAAMKGTPAFQGCQYVSPPATECIFTCEHCGVEFRRAKGNMRRSAKHRFCSTDCHDAWRKSSGPRGRYSPLYNRIDIHCAYCGEMLHVIPAKAHRHNNHFCGHSCYAAWRRANWVLEQHPRWRGHENKYRDERNEWSQRAGKYWRISVYKAADYTCAICGKSDCEVHAHHAWPWAQYPQWRSSLWNGICLCSDCHHSIHRTENAPLKWSLAWTALFDNYDEAVGEIPLALPAVA